MSAKHPCIALLVTLLTLLFGWSPSMAGQRWYQVKWIIDGDTIFLEDNRTVRFIGVNTPEIAHNDRSAEPFGDAAKAALTKLLHRRTVRLQWDQRRGDRYGRTLAHVFDCDNRLISQVMVAAGLAHVLYHSENQLYFNQLLKSQQKAMVKNKGFWKAFSATKKNGYFVGNKRSLRFHAHTCKEGKKIYHANKIIFTDAKSAFEQGYAPAKKCLKGIGMFLK